MGELWKSVKKEAGKPRKVNIQTMFLVCTICLLIGSVAMSELTIGTTVWEIDNYAGGINVGSVQYIDTDAIVPVQVIERTGTTISLDPDKKGSTRADDGFLPEVLATISQIYHCDRDGMSTDPSIPVAEYDAQGLHWQQHFYQMDVMLRTRSSECNYHVFDNGMFPQSQFDTYEFGAVIAKFYAKINLNTGFTGEGLKSGWGGAKIVYVESGTVIPEYKSEQLVYKDDAWAAQPTYSVGANLGVFKSTGTEEDKNFYVELSASLKSGVKYNYGWFEVRVNVAHQIDTYVKYSIRYSIMITRSLVVEQRADTMLEAPQDTISDKMNVNPFAGLFGNFASGILFLLALGFGFIFLMMLVKRLLFGSGNKTIIVK